MTTKAKDKVKLVSAPTQDTPTLSIQEQFMDAAKALIEARKARNVASEVVEKKRKAMQDLIDANKPAFTAWYASVDKAIQTALRVFMKKPETATEKAEKRVKSVAKTSKDAIIRLIETDDTAMATIVHDKIDFIIAELKKLGYKVSTPALKLAKVA